MKQSFNLKIPSSPSCSRRIIIHKQTRTITLEYSKNGNNNKYEHKDSKGQYTNTIETSKEQSRKRSYAYNPRCGIGTINTTFHFLKNGNI